MSFRRPISLIAFFLFACTDEPSEVVFESPSYCTEEQAKIAGESRVAELLSEVENEETREQACTEIDDLIRDRYSREEYEAFRPEGCERSSTDSDPYEFAEVIMREQENKLAELCQWRRKDAERRGRQILDSLPQEERRQIEEEWNSYGTN